MFSNILWAAKLKCKILSLILYKCHIFLAEFMIKELSMHISILRVWIEEKTLYHLTNFLNFISKSCKPKFIYHCLKTCNIYFILAKCKSNWTELNHTIYTEWNYGDVVNTNNLLFLWQQKYFQDGPNKIWVMSKLNLLVGFGGP